MVVSKQVDKIFQKAVDRFSTVEEIALEDWQPMCDCQKPGIRLTCQDCPFFRAYVARLQKIVSSSEMVSNLPIILAPTLQPPFSEKVKQQCVSLYQQNCTIEEIQNFVGITSREVIREWLYEADVLKKEGSYSPEIRQQCVALYEAGKPIKEIEDQLRVSAEAISHWVNRANLSRSKPSYSSQQQQMSLTLYQQGKKLKEIEAMTAVRVEHIQAWVKEAGYKRSKPASGRPPIYSAELREECLRLLEEGKTTAQVELIKGVTAGTILQWARKAKQTQQMES